MATPNRTQIGLLILASIGAGTLIGAAIGLLLSQRASREAQVSVTESVEELKQKTERMLEELTGSVAALVHRSQEPIPELREEESREGWSDTTAALFSRSTRPTEGELS